MRLTIIRLDKTSEWLVFTTSVIFVLWALFMMLTKQYEQETWRNDIYFISLKTAILINAITYFRLSKGALTAFTMSYLTVSITLLLNELFYVFKICNTDSYKFILIEIFSIFITLFVYRKKITSLN